MRIRIQVFIPLFALMMAWIACIPPQDCILTEATVKGSVLDEQGKPIAGAEIHIENTPVDSSTPSKRTLFTDAHGKFGAETVYFFKCENITFTVIVNGFESHMVSYILDYGLLNSLPDEMNIILKKAE